MYVLNRSILRRYGTLITREGSARYYRLYLPGVINIVSRHSLSLPLSLSLSRARARVRSTLRIRSTINPPRGIAEIDEEPRAVHYWRSPGGHYSSLTRSLIRARYRASVGRSILFEGNVPTNKRGNLPPPSPSSSRRSRTEAGANRANSVTTRRGSRGSSAKLSLRTKTTDKTMAAPRCQEVT